jgi:hypothetical protein
LRIGKTIMNQDELVNVGHGSTSRAVAHQVVEEENMSKFLGKLAVGAAFSTAALLIAAPSAALADPGDGYKPKKPKHIEKIVEQQEQVQATCSQIIEQLQKIGDQTNAWEFGIGGETIENFNLNNSVIVNVAPQINAALQVQLAANLAASLANIVPITDCTGVQVALSGLPGVTSDDLAGLNTFGDVADLLHGLSGSYAGGFGGGLEVTPEGGVSLGGGGGYTGGPANGPSKVPNGSVAAGDGGALAASNTGGLAAAGAGMLGVAALGGLGLLRRRSADETVA